MYGEEKNLAYGGCGSNPIIILTPKKNQLCN